MNKEATAKVYTLYTESGSWLGQVVLTTDGSFMSITDYGNFAYNWNGFGEDIRKFILSLSVDYFAQKMFNGMCYVSSTDKIYKSALFFSEKILPVLQEVLKKEIDSEQQNNNIMNGCELSKCPYWNGIKCTDKNEYVNVNGDLVCGLRDDSILKE